MSTLFSGVTAVLMDEAHTVLKNAFVLVESGKIAAVSQVRPAGFAGEEIDGKGKVLLPGFVNAHAHTAMTLMRGYGGGHDLHDWLENFIFPTEAKWDDRSIRPAVDLGLAEMIASGVTCLADMYGPGQVSTDVIAQAMLDAGVSANLCNGAVYFGEPDAFDPDTCADCAHQIALTEKWHGAGDGRIRIDASLHAEYTSSAPLWTWMARYAKDHGLGFHVHLSETKKEHEECIARHGVTPAGLFERYGLWDSRAIAAHCVWTTPEDWAILAKHNVTAVHNPVSNLKLGSGVAPIPAMKKAGVNVALGTDGVSSNNATDLFFDMKLAAILHNGVGLDPMAMTAWDALEMATVNGARALGRKAGRIEAGYAADLILVDFDVPNLIPCHDAAENLVFSASGANVVMNMCRGRVIYKDGQFLTIDMDKVKRELADYAMPKLFG